MKKALIIANMLFASATVWGMMPNDHNDNFGNKRKFFRIEESSGENRQPEKKSRNLSKEILSDLSIKQVIVWDVRDSKIFRPSNISDESLLPFRRSVLNLKPYVTTPAGRNFQLALSTRAYAQTMKATDVDVLKLGGKFPNLRELSINASDLLNISLESLSFPALEILKIEGEVSDEADNADLTSQISQLISKSSETLQVLDVSGTEIGTLPSEIVNCRNLIRLDCSNTKVENLPANIENCKNLQYLDISDNGMDNIPDIVFEFRELKHLEFLYSSEANGRMENLLPKINNLTNLEFLAITGQFSLKTLPPEIGYLKNLKTLILEANGLESLPKEIGNLENLNYLDLSTCALETLPAEIGKLRNLETLNIENNEELESIPPEILNLFENRLKATDKEPCNLTLRYLLAYKNKTAMNDDALKKFMEQNQKEVEMLKERRNNLKSSLVGLRFYADADDESVSGSESDSENQLNRQLTHPRNEGGLSR